ncbi:MAG TPA: hypothetical protein VFI56_27320 [Vicinamibacterales bacterium]|nr:hypothetical protein [Vicinamibacterales bacterium]
MIYDEPGFLLIARERLRPGSADAYNENEIQIATACATLNGPHPYLALVCPVDPAEVWWVNAFASEVERDGLGEAYARNEPLMTRIAPLGKRKEDFRETFTTIALTRHPDVDGRESLQIAGARYLIVSTSKDAKTSRSVAVFKAPDGESFTIATAATRAGADEAAARFDQAASILAVQPQWSFPAEAWVRADPDFWSSNPAARIRRWT